MGWNDRWKQESHIARIKDLDQQIDAQNKAISAVVAMAAKEAASSGSVDTGEAIQSATKSLVEEVGQLQEMRTLAANWLAEIEESDRKARDLKALAQKARNEFRNMTAEDQGEIIAQLDLTVFFEGPVPANRSGVRCTVQAWYRSVESDVPAEDLSDEAWSRVEPLLPRGRGGTVRRSVNAILYKARTGASWPAVRAVYGSVSAASKYFNEWSADGTWAQVDRALGDIARVPVPSPDLLPPMRIEGHLDPRVILVHDEPSPKGW